MTVHIFLEVLLMEIRDLSISYPFCKKKKREGNIILRILGLHLV